tara:strand:- start:3965 stop:5458 length:1494 start_codon:yes stop_codon:yes gene_type:complete
MAEEIVISVSTHETRVAVVEQGLLQEIFIERHHSRGTLGNIYKGRVVRVLPGMQSAFVDIGVETAAFLHVSDLIQHRLRAFDDRGSDDREAMPLIESVLTEGQDLLLQVTKEPISTKGARATTEMSLASRYLVYMPLSPHLGISQRIEDEEERARLTGILTTVFDPTRGDGFIVRTASERAEREEILQDARLLRARWDRIQEDERTVSAPGIVYEDMPLHLRTVRDIINRDTRRILVDQEGIHDAVGRFLTDFIPDKQSVLELSSNEMPLFDKQNLEEQMQIALNKKVDLKSGGYLIIDQTEAMTTVDVNTGAFVGRKDLEDTIYQTNLEAAWAIPRQLRLRNIGGIVILDFIDMVDEEHKRQVLRTLEKGQQLDRVRWKITEISALGLVEMTRKRTHESLLNTMSEPCPICDGKGFIKTAETVCLEIFRDIQRQREGYKDAGCLIRASQTVVDRLIDEDAPHVRTLAENLGTSISCQVEVSYSQEQFDVIRTLRSD